MDISGTKWTTGRLVHNDRFGQRHTAVACFGASGGRCARTSLTCGSGIILIEGIGYHSGEKGCDNMCHKDRCLCGVYREEGYQDRRHEARIYDACSALPSCEVDLPDVTDMTELTGFTLMSISVSYYCVTDDIVDFCARKMTPWKKSYKRMYFMYNGGHDGYVHGECYCSLRANNKVGPALYWLDVRLHQQAVATPLVCGKTSLYWGVGSTSHNTSFACVDPYYRAPFMDEHGNKKIARTWVQLHLGEDKPSIVGIMAEGDGFDVQCRGFEEFQTTEMSPTTTSTEIPLPSKSHSPQSTMSVADPSVSPETLPSSTTSSFDVTKQGYSTGIVSPTPASSTYVTNRGPETGIEYNRVTVSNSMSSSTSNGLSENSADGGLGVHWIITLAVLGTVMSRAVYFLVSIFGKYGDPEYIPEAIRLTGKPWRQTALSVDVDH
ncbi:hypothetical protein ScPMuIL_016058 [Solemya velum]